MRPWIKYAIEVDGIKKYFSTAEWRVDTETTNKNVADSSSGDLPPLEGRYKLYSEYMAKYLRRDSAILSIGSGYARNEIFLHKSGFNIICTDVDSSSIEYVKKQEPNMSYVLYNPILTPYEKKFDVVISLGVLYYFSTSELALVFR